MTRGVGQREFAEDILRFVEQNLSDKYFSTQGPSCRSTTGEDTIGLG